VYLAANLVQEGRWTFSPETEPFMFEWQRLEGLRWVAVRFRDWDAILGDASARDLARRGQLRVSQERYYIASTGARSRYVTAYGPIPALAAVPLFAAVRIAGGDLTGRPDLPWYAAKSAASMVVALSALFVFLVAAGIAGNAAAWGISLAYGLGTGVWSTSSQALWQHGPSALALAIGIHALARPSSARSRGTAGLAFGAVFAARPTLILLGLAVFVFLIVQERRRAPWFALGALGTGGVLLAFNAHFLGAPWATGQGILAAKLALLYTGSPSLWQTPLPIGLLGLLASPSRGLFVYSPFLLFAVAGLAVGWRQPRTAWMGPLALGALGVACLNAAYFQWWGSWSFGTRYLVDLMPLLALGLLGIRGPLMRRPLLLAVFSLALGWSVLVQGLGAFAYDVAGWNARQVVVDTGDPGRPWVDLDDVPGVERLAEMARGELAVRALNIDAPENSGRLWSWEDSPLVYYATRFWQARAAKRALMARWIEGA